MSSRTLNSLHKVNDSRHESDHGSARPESEKWFLVRYKQEAHVDNPVSEYRVAVAATRITTVSREERRSGTLFIYYSRR